MQSEVLKNIISTHKERFLRNKQLVLRDIIKENRKSILAKEILFITGIRRGGKSSLLYLIYEFLQSEKTIPVSNILFINFEDERFTNFTTDDFNLLYNTYLELDDPKGKKYLFFDEIQNVPGWERWVNRLYEFEDVKIFITGSNASLSGLSVSTSLTGRNRQLENHTFSFTEYARLQQIILSNHDIHTDVTEVKYRRLLNRYMATGGFPEALKNNDISIVDQYFKDIFYRDIVSRYQIRNNKEIKELAIQLISHTGLISSYDNLKKLTGARNTTTIKNYLTIFEDVFLIYALPVFSYSVKKQIYNPNKYYAGDIGFYHAVGFKFSDNSGRLLENIVLHELRRKNTNLFYWKSEKGHEVDFVIQEKEQITTAIQVCYHLNDSNSERECRGLADAKREIEANRLMIITYEQSNDIVYEQQKITVISFIRWVIQMNLSC